MKLMFTTRVSFLVPMMELYFEETFSDGKAYLVYDNAQEARTNYCQKYITYVSKGFYSFCKDRIDISKIDGLRTFHEDGTDEDVVNATFVYWVMYTYTPNELYRMLFP